MSSGGWQPSAAQYRQQLKHPATHRRCWKKAPQNMTGGMTGNFGLLCTLLPHLKLKYQPFFYSQKTINAFAFWKKAIKNMQSSTSAIWKGQKVDKTLQKCSETTQCCCSLIRIPMPITYERKQLSLLPPWQGLFLSLQVRCTSQGGSTLPPWLQVTPVLRICYHTGRLKDHFQTHFIT